MESNNVEFSNRISYVHEERCDVYVGGACNCIMKEVRAKLKAKDEALEEAVAQLDTDKAVLEMLRNSVLAVDFNDAEAWAVNAAINGIDEAVFSIDKALGHEQEEEAKK